MGSIEFIHHLQFNDLRKDDGRTKDSSGRIYMWSSDVVDVHKVRLFASSMEFTEKGFRVKKKNWVTFLLIIKKHREKSVYGPFRCPG